MKYYWKTANNDQTHFSLFQIFYKKLIKSYKNYRRSYVGRPKSMCLRKAGVKIGLCFHMIVRTNQSNFEKTTFFTKTLLNNPRSSSRVQTQQSCTTCKSSTACFQQTTLAKLHWNLGAGPRKFSCCFLTPSVIFDPIIGNNNKQGLRKEGVKITNPDNKKSHVLRSEPTESAYFLLCPLPFGWLLADPGDWQV